MFWTIVGAILFVMFLPLIISVSASIIGFTMALFIAVLIISLLFSILKEFYGYILEANYYDELSILQVSIIPSLLILGIILRYTLKMKLPSIFVPEFFHAISNLESPEFLSYLKNHYKITFGDSGYLQKKSVSKKHLEKIKNSISVKNMNLETNYRLKFESRLYRDIEKSFQI